MADKFEVFEVLMLIVTAKKEKRKAIMATRRQNLPQKT